MEDEKIVSGDIPTATRNPTSERSLPCGSFGGNWVVDSGGTICQLSLTSEGVGCLRELPRMNGAAQPRIKWNINTFGAGRRM